ncbi:hypothetical protein H4R35_001886 [Dimargaris xerosporica]|nr:hypothetical protein H4R35_001886 [Dimargaris xerosporica]
MTNAKSDKPLVYRLACDECHRLKVKCTKERPCQRCASRSLDCVYSPIVRRPPTSFRRKGRSDLTALGGSTHWSRSVPAEYHSLTPSLWYGMPMAAPLGVPQPAQWSTLMQKFTEITERLGLPADGIAAADPSFGMSFTGPSARAPSYPAPTVTASTPDWAGASLAPDVHSTFGSVYYTTPQASSSSPVSDDGGTIRDNGRRYSLQLSSDSSNDPLPMPSPRPVSATTCHYTDLLAQLGMSESILVTMVNSFYQLTPPTFAGRFVERFIIRLKLGIVSPFLAYAVVAAGAHLAWVRQVVHLPNAQYLFNAKQLLAWRSHGLKLADQVMFTAMESPSLDHMAAFLISAMLYNMQGQTNKSHQTMSLALNMGLVMRLHLTKEDAWPPNISPQQAAQDTLMHAMKANPAILQREFEIRYWWEVYARDIVASVALERNPSVQSADVSCPFPTADSVFHAVLLDLMADPTSEFMTSPDYPTVFQISVMNAARSQETLELVTICSIAQTHMARRHISCHQVEVALPQIHAALTQWWAKTMPEHFDLDPDHLPDDVKASKRQVYVLMNQRLNAHAMYQTTLLALHTIPPPCRHSLSPTFLAWSHAARCNAVQAITALIRPCRLYNLKIGHYILALAFTQVAYLFLGLIPGTEVQDHFFSTATGMLSATQADHDVSPTEVVDHTELVPTAPMQPNASASRSSPPSHVSDQQIHKLLLDVVHRSGATAADTGLVRAKPHSQQPAPLSNTLTRSTSSSSLSATASVTSLPTVEADAKASLAESTISPLLLSLPLESHPASDPDMDCLAKLLTKIILGRSSSPATIETIPAVSPQPSSGGTTADRLSAEISEVDASFNFISSLWHPEGVTKIPNHKLELVIHVVDQYLEVIAMFKECWGFSKTFLADARQRLKAAAVYFQPPSSSSPP